jgi:hypothetical protein
LRFLAAVSGNAVCRVSEHLSVAGRHIAVGKQSASGAFQGGRFYNLDFYVSEALKRIALMEPGQ